MMLLCPNTFEQAPLLRLLSPENSMTSRTTVGRSCLHSVEDWQAKVGGAAFLGRHPAHHLCAICNGLQTHYVRRAIFVEPTAQCDHHPSAQWAKGSVHLFTVKRAVLSCKTLCDDLGCLVDEHCGLMCLRKRPSPLSRESLA